MRGITTVLVFLVSTYAFGLEFLAVQSGAWNAGATWGIVCPDNVCVQGEHYPGPSDNAYTEGHSVRIPGGTFQVNNLYIAYNVANGINKTLGTSTLVINGQMVSYDPSTFNYAAPNTAIVNNSSTGWSIQFTGQGLAAPTDPVIFSWSSAAPLRVVSFNPPSSSTTLYTDGLAVANGGSLTINNGGLTLNPGQTIQAVSSPATITVNAGASLTLLGSVNGNGTPSSLFPTVINNGTINTGNNAYLNASSLTIGANAALNVSFNGSNQTQSWWYQNAAPVMLSIDPTSTVSYNGDANQNIYATTYGNLSLSSNVNVVKTIVGAGDFTVSGSFNVVSSGVSLVSSNTNPKRLGGNVVVNGSWVASQLTIFNGGSPQVLNGTGTIEFNGGLEIPTGSSVLLNRNLSINGGLTLGGTLNVGSYTLTVNGGNILDNGTFSFDDGVAGGTIIINGVSSISGSSITSFNNLIITSSGNLTAPTGVLNLTGDFTNSGTFNRNGGTVSFSGAGAQDVNGTVSFHSMDVSNSVGVNINGNVSLFRTLTLIGTGSFDADGPANTGIFTLRSTNESSAARISRLPDPNNFEGQVTVERYMVGDYSWRYLSVPVEGSNLGQWHDDFPITGNFSNPSPASANVINPTAASVYTFNPSTQAWVAVSNPGNTTSQTPLSNTTAYSAFDYTRATDAAIVLDVRGPIGKGQKNFILQSQSNLIPNPYPSAIDWDSVDLSSASLTTNAIYVRTANNVFASYVQHSGLGTGHSDPAWHGQVATGQCFWVNASANSVLTMNENAKISSYRFVRQAEPVNYVRIKLNSSDKMDEAVIYFSKEATLDTDRKYDALKRKNGEYSKTLKRNNYLNLSSYIDDPEKDYSINGVPLVNCSFGAKLKVADVAQGTYFLSFSDLHTLSLGYEVKLVDHFLKTEKVIREGTTYPFDVTADSASFEPGRFEVIFSSPSIDTTTLPSLVNTQECSPESVKVILEDGKKGVRYQLFLGDAALTESQTSNGQDLSFELSRADLTHGTNLLSLQAATSDNCNSFRFQDAFEFVVEEDPIIESVVNGKSCGPGDVLLKANASAELTTFKWYKDADSEEPLYVSVENSFVTPELSKSRTYYVSAVNAMGCESGRVPVEANIVYVEQPFVTMDGTVLISSSNVNNQWYKNGEKIEGQTGRTFVMTESGEYTVGVSIAGCEVYSENTAFVITDVPEQKDMGVKLYPNPVETGLVIEIPAEIEKDLRRIVLLDLTGKEVANVSAIEALSDGNMNMDLTDLKSGVYFLNLMTGQRIITLQVIKKQ